MKISKLIFCTVILCFSFLCCNNSVKYFKHKGQVFGTFYSIIYEGNTDLFNKIQSKFKEYDNSLSNYNKESVVSYINENKSDSVDQYLSYILNLSEDIARKTDGAFDITVAPLVNAWGFGFKNSKFPNKAMIDSIMNYVGYNKIQIEDGKVKKQNTGVIVDLSAIAKGYACDVIANLLEREGVENYMVEIGGEIRAKGKSEKSRAWRVGIDKPIDDKTGLSHGIEAIISMEKSAMATSGNYRQFYIKDGKKYSHTINPITGYPVDHNLLSATVIAENCAMADAYATTFMVMGTEKTIDFVKANNFLEILLIYSDEDSKLKTYMTKGMKSKIIK
jgi:thiamine biosynthesis lipoprotein